MSINNKKTRRLSAAMVTCALAITLTSCSGATNKYGSLDEKATYATVGDYSLTNGELWNELQWDAKDVLDTQIANVILNEQITRLTNVLNTEGDYSKLSDKKIIHGSTDEITEEKFNQMYEEYSNRIVDYVVQDIADYTYNQEGYWDNFEKMDKTLKEIQKQKYVDGIYTEFQKSSIADGDYKGKTYKELIENISEDNKTPLLAIAKDLSELYYPQYAKELFTYDTLCDEAAEAFEDDTDSDDEKYGAYTNSEYVNAFKKLYTNTYNLNMIKIKFVSETEFKDVLRAFGILINNNKYYYIFDDKDDKSKTLDYSAYIEYYDEFTSSSSLSNNLKTSGAELISGRVMLEIYIMLYNYMYGGYRDELPSASGVVLNFDNLNELRAQTYKLIAAYKVGDQNTLYNNTIKALEEFDANLPADGKLLEFTPEYLTDTYNATLKTYCFETLLLQDKNQYDNYDTRYSTSLQNANNSNLIFYKFGDEFDEIADEKIKSYEEKYLDKNNTTIDYFDFLTSEENKDLFDEVLNKIIKDSISSSIIDNRYNEALEDVKVKVYTEATEIAYAKDHSNYSKSVGSAPNGNILAAITYNDKTLNLNIKANKDDTNSILIPGTSEAFGVFDYLERTKGITTAIDLLSKKMVRDTDQYKKTLKDSDTRKIYETYIQSVLLAFANDSYSSSGYPSTIGKYNFLMLYYHTADVNKIVEDYYLLQVASANLLADYSNKTLADFLKSYADIAYEKYFSLSGKQLLIYMDEDEDGTKDEASTWVNEIVPNWECLDGTVADVTKAYVARQLAYTIYNKVSAAANTSHVTKAEDIVAEINDSAKAEYNDNPTASENIWAKYKKLGLNVELVDLEVTNSSTTGDYAIKQRLYDYARGYNSDNTKTYQFYINETTPTEYIEQISVEDIANDDVIIESDNGINLLFITSGTSNPSAEYSIEEYDDTLYKNMIIKYNEQFIKIAEIYNENDMLNSNQILLYLLASATSQSDLIPSSLSSAYTQFLSPVYTRFTSSETQRIVLLFFMKKFTNTNKELYDTIVYANDAYNGKDGVLQNIIVINQNIADEYNNLENDTTGTSNLYPDWWQNLNEHVENFLNNLKKETE